MNIYTGDIAEYIAEKVKLILKAREYADKIDIKGLLNRVYLNAKVYFSYLQPYRRDRIITDISFAWRLVAIGHGITLVDKLNSGRALTPEPDEFVLIIRNHWKELVEYISSKKRDTFIKLGKLVSELPIIDILEKIERKIYVKNYIPIYYSDRYFNLHKTVLDHKYVEYLVIDSRWPYFITAVDGDTKVVGYPLFSIGTILSFGDYLDIILEEYKELYKIIRRKYDIDKINRIDERMREVISPYIISKSI